ncbi:MAG TPA: hypothetical protein VGJ83_02535 [Gemmatimonadales bacterium]
MPTRPSRSPAILTVLIAWSLAPATAQTSGRQITLQEAREILGTSPAAIPGFPVELYRLDGRAVLIRQRLDSGRVIVLREDRQGRPQVFETTTIADEKQRFLDGRPSAAEERSRALKSYRQIGSLSVRYLGSAREPIPHDLLDRLEPIP